MESTFKPSYRCHCRLSTPGDSRGIPFLVFMIGGCRREGKVIVGKHRRQRHAAHSQVAAPRGPRLIGITDARTHTEHLVSEATLAARRHAGQFLAQCGAEVLAASLTALGRDYCRECTR